MARHGARCATVNLEFPFPLASAGARARSDARSRGVKNLGVGTVVLGAYSFTGAPNPDSFGDAAVMTYEVQSGQWRTRGGR